MLLVTPLLAAATDFEASWRRLQNDLQGQSAFLLSLDPSQLPSILQVSLKSACAAL